MDEPAASEGTVVRFPPGAPAPRAADRIAALKDPDRLAKLNEGKAAWYALPKEERQRITAERQAKKRAREAEREAKRAGKNGHTVAPPDTAADHAPPTVRSQRSGLTDAPPDSAIPRPGVRGGPLKGLLDLCEALPQLGDGSCFIQVTRLKPPVAFGIPCAGTQKPLWGPVDDAEFTGLYGGAEYSLRGYALRDDGRTKALTEPVAYKVSGPPNLDSALTEEDAMRPQAAHIPNGGGGGPSALRRPGLVTPHAATAEAEMYDRNLTHKETMDLREQEREEARRTRLERQEQQRERGATDMARLVSERADKEAERLRESYEQQLQSKGSNLAEMADLLKVLKPDGDQSKELVRQHAAEIKQLTEAHREQLAHLTDSHQAEMRRQSEAHTAAMQRLDDQVRADRDRADKLIRETDQRSSDQIREAERRADQRVTDAQNAARTTYEDLKTRSEERLRDQAEAAKQRFDDARDNHARDLKRKDDELVLMRTGIEGNVSIILANKDTEIKRLERELREAKSLIENGKDWVGRMKEAEQQAEALGYSKPEPGEGAADEDLKTTAIKAGLGVLQQLPQIIQSGADAIAKVRNPGAPADFPPGQQRVGAARGHMRTVPRTMGGGPAPVMLAPLPFATEDGGYTAPSDVPLAPRQYAPAPIAPLEQSPTQAIVPAGHEFPVAAPPQQDPPQAAPQAASPPQEHMAPPPPAPSVAPPPPSLTPNPATEINPAAVGLIQGALPSLASAFSQHVSPQAVAQSIIDETGGIDQARVALSLITIDQLLAVIAQDVTPEHRDLKTRNGQKFLRDIWRAAEQLVA